MIERNDGSSHLDLPRLDAVRAGEGDPADLLHLGECASCRAALHRLIRTAEALVEAHPRPAEVPASVDRAVLERFRRERVRRRRFIPFPVPRPWAWPAVGAALAAVMAVALYVGERRAPVQVAPDRPPAEVIAERAAAPAVHPRAPGDVNGDGSLDILDAMALARAVERHEAPAAWDLTGDGLVDRADVDVAAQRAVLL